MEFALAEGLIPKESLLLVSYNFQTNFFLDMLRNAITTIAVSAVLFACSGKTDKKSTVTEDKTTKTETADKAEASKATHSSSESGKEGEMIFFKGGTFMMGNDKGTPVEKPAHSVEVADFYMDKTPVTVGQFRKFINATGYKTDAEGYGDSMVFDFNQKNWIFVKQANWEYPLGKQQPKAADDHPVTQVSWNDANAYAKWAEKRLPSEVEWEYAARNGGKDVGLYPWGNDEKVDGQWKANVFQGNVYEYTVEDGFLTTNPVGAFGETPAGLVDMVGNVWQWTNNPFYLYEGNTQPYNVVDSVKTMRGGSFMIDEENQLGYTVYFRRFRNISDASFNTGFRCVK